MKIGEGISGALFSQPDRCFRYALWRTWRPSVDRLLFIGLNPSTANQYKDDPTVTRLVNLAKAWGFGSVFVGNLFSYVSSWPGDLEKSEAQEALGDLNDTALAEMRTLCNKVMVGWGDYGKPFNDRINRVLGIIGPPVYCIKTNRSGEPVHPLYQPASSRLEPYTRKEKVLL